MKCKVCRQPVEDDGYGEPIHSDTGLYGSYSMDDPGKWSKLSHVAAV